MRTFWLNFHVGYACRHRGVCCSSRWPIPVERHRVEGIRRTTRREHWLVPAAGAPDDVAGTLALQSNGHCVFHRGGSCEVHPLRPLSCSHFPYVCLIDQRGVRVTLSHYCPTAAQMLFDHDGPIEIVEGPPPEVDGEIPEGLDARESLPPLASPNRLMSFDEFSEWERAAVAGVAWRPGALAPAAAIVEHARGAVPAPLTWPEAPAQAEEAWVRLVEPAWASFSRVIGRYLAARTFASWAAYLGDGIAAVERSAEVARAVLMVEAARRCAADDRALDAARLKDAIRQSDLLLVHYADARAATRSW